MDRYLLLFENGETEEVYAGSWVEVARLVESRQNSIDPEVVGVMKLDV